MATKVIGLKISIQDANQIAKLEQDLIKLRQERSRLNKRVKEGNGLNAAEAQQLGRLKAKTDETRKALNEKTKALTQNNAALKKNSGFVAGVRKGVGQWATSMIGVTAAIAGVSKVIGSVSKTIKDFDQDMANLKAITGSSTEQMEGFREAVLNVSKDTGKGASEIAKAFQLVGSAKPELLSSAEALGEVTKQSVLLSQAGGLEVPEAAAALTKAMNQFGASADDAAMFTDILATSQQKGTATIAQLSESLKNVGAVANSAGLTFEETNASLQALAKGGLVAGEAGTGLRGVLLRLQKAGIGFKDGQFDIEEALKQTEERFNSIQDPVKLAQEKTTLFGTENVKTIDTLIAQRDVLTELNGKLNDYGNASEQAAIVTATIEGKTEALSSQWDRFIISLDEGSSAIGNAYKGILQFAQDALSGLENLDLIWKETFSGLGEFTQKELERTLDGAWATEAGENISEVVKRFDEIPFDKFQGNIAEIQDQWISQLGEDQSDAIELFKGYVNQRIAAEKKLNTELANAEAPAANEEEGGSELTPEEIAAINKKAKSRAEAEAKAKAEAEKKAEEDRVNRAAAAQDEINKIRLQKLVESFQSERDQELINEGIKFDEKIAKIQGDSEEEKALIVELEQQKRDAIKALQTRFDEEDKAKQAADKELKLENDLIEAEGDFERQREILEQQRTQELEAEGLTGEQRRAINLKFDKEISDNKKKEEDFRRQQTQASLSVVAGAFDSIAGLAEEGSAEAKALAVASAIINSYLAFNNALANTPAPPPFPQIAAGAALATGLATVRKITATKAAKGMYLEDGGMIKGASHANGGVPFTVDGVGGFEAEGGEAIINKRSTAMFAPLLSQINQAGGGVAFKRGGLVSKFQNGGTLTPNNVGVTAQQQGLFNNAENLSDLGDTIISGFNDKEVINVATNTSEVATEVINTEAEASF